ncbi:MAG TPA: type 4 pilus major pilin [Rhodanobacteraceae bacterium]|nr:type 4 pilus major pilin [Rhodanobacteraceae bacterium]
MQAAPPSRRCQQGATLIERLLVIFVLASLTLGAAWAGMEAYKARRIAQVRQEVEKIMELVHSIYPTDSPNGYTGLNSAQLASALADVMRFDASANAFINAFGGTTSVNRSDWEWGTSETGRLAMITVRGVPSSACVELAVYFQDKATAVSINYGNQTIHAPNAMDATLATIETYCSTPPIAGKTSYIAIFFV